MGVRGLAWAGREEAQLVQRQQGSGKIEASRVESTNHDLANLCCAVVGLS